MPSRSIGTQPSSVQGRTAKIHHLLFGLGIISIIFNIYQFIGHQTYLKAVTNYSRDPFNAPLPEEIHRAKNKPKRPAAKPNNAKPTKTRRPNNSKNEPIKPAAKLNNSKPTQRPRNPKPTNRPTDINNVQGKHEHRTKGQSKTQGGKGGGKSDVSDKKQSVKQSREGVAQAGPGEKKIPYSQLAIYNSTKPKPTQKPRKKPTKRPTAR